MYVRCVKTHWNSYKSYCDLTFFFNYRYIYCAVRPMTANLTNRVMISSQFCAELRFRWQFPKKDINLYLYLYRLCNGPLSLTLGSHRSYNGQQSHIIPPPHNFSNNGDYAPLTTTRIGSSLNLATSRPTVLWPREAPQRCIFPRFLSVQDSSLHSTTLWIFRLLLQMFFSLDPLVTKNPILNIRRQRFLLSTPFKKRRAQVVFSAFKIGWQQKTSNDIWCLDSWCFLAASGSTEENKTLYFDPLSENFKRIICHVINMIDGNTLDKVLINICVASDHLNALSLKASLDIPYARHYNPRLVYFYSIFQCAGRHSVNFGANDFSFWFRVNEILLFQSAYLRQHNFDSAAPASRSSYWPRWGWSCRVKMALTFVTEKPLVWELSFQKHFGRAIFLWLWAKRRSH